MLDSPPNVLGGEPIVGFENVCPDDDGDRTELEQQLAMRSGLRPINLSASSAYG